MQRDKAEENGTEENDAAENGAVENGTVEIGTVENNTEGNSTVENGIAQENTIEEISVSLQSDTPVRTEGGQEIHKETLLRTLTELRAFVKELAEALNLAWGANLQSGRLADIVISHRQMAQAEDSLFARNASVASLLGYLLGKITQETLEFHLPNQPEGLPEEENEQLDRISGMLKDLNETVENQVGGLFSLGQTDNLPTEGRSHLVLRPISGLFKGIIRQDWADVELMMDHINMVTTSRQSYELTNQVGRLIRNIYVGLNEISRDFPMESLRNSTGAIPDATETLNSVIHELEAGTNRNLDLLETLSFYVEEDKKRIESGTRVLAECEEECVKLIAEHPQLAEKLEAVRGVLRDGAAARISGMEKSLQENHDRFMVLFANQSYQDLTGQTLKKVIAFIETLQYQLIQVIVKGRKDQANLKLGLGTKKSNELIGPDAADRLSQDNVDTLLAELGF